MTAREGGPSTVISSYPAHVFGATANAKFMDHMSNQQATDVAIPLKHKTESSHDIAAHDLLYMIKPDSYKALGFSQAFNIQDYGKPLVLSQVGNMPHGLTKEFMKSAYYLSLTPAEQEELKRQSVKRHIVFAGSSKDSYYKAKDQNHTPDQNGLAMIMHGVDTVRLFTGVPIRPLAQFVMDLIPAQSQGRGGTVRYQSDGPDRSPITVREFSPQATIVAAKNALRAFSMKVESKNKTWLFGNKVEATSGKGIMLDIDLHGQAMALGILEMGLVLVDVLVTEGVLGVAGGVDWKKRGPEVLCLDKLDTKTPEELAKNMNIVSTILTRIATRQTGRMEFDTLASSGLVTFLNGTQGIAAACNQIIGRNLGTRPQAFGQTGGGMYEYDLFFKAV